MMTKDEFVKIVQKFNEDKVKFNWREIINQFKNFTTHVYDKYILNKPNYYTFNSGKEFKYWINHSDDLNFCENRFCPICGKFITKIVRKDWFYAKACCEEHSAQLAIINAQKTNIERYGHKSPMHNANIQEKVHENWKNKSKEEIDNHVDKIKNAKLKIHNDKNYNNRELAKETCLKRYGVENPLQIEKIKEKVKNTNLERYGTVAPIQNPVVKAKIEKTTKERYGTSKIGHVKEIRDKINNTMNEKYGGHGLKSNVIKEKVKNTNLERYGVPYPTLDLEIMKKARQTCIEKYNSKYPLQNKEIYHKTINAKKENGTLNTSHNFEDMLVQYLKDTYPQYTILTQYNEDPRYPYMCDCYIKELDLFIEFQGSYFHNWRPFDYSAAHIKEYEEMIAYGGQKETIANVWRYKDTEKRECARRNNLNYLEYWEKLIILPEEIRNNQNNLILYYQQKLFYAKNREELFDPIKRWEYYKNAIEYSDFYKRHGYVSHLTLLRRPYFLHQIGYSSFNIKLCEIIDKKYSVYDPCGGWGHRLLGFKNHKQYIYNDISLPTLLNCEKLAKDQNITNCKFYNQDAALPIQNEYDVVFTCPPYFNKEIFTSAGAENYTEERFIEWWNEVLNNLKPKTGEIYIVINSNYLKYFISNDYKYEIVNTSLRKSHYHKNSKISNEIIIKFIKI